MLYLFSTSVHLCNDTPIDVAIKPIATMSEIAIASLSEIDKPEEKIFLNAKKIFYCHAIIF